MSQLTVFQPQGQLSAAVQQHLAQSGGVIDTGLSDNVGASHATVSIKGKVFRIRHGAAEVPLVDQATNAPIPYFDVVIVMANGHLSKTFYMQGFQEGTSEAPDCASEDGVHPFAPAGKQVQCHDCRLCPQNAFGSKVSTDGRATNSKACADTRKLAIVPEFDMLNARFGGPMLLRVPADSLSGLANFSRAMQGTPYYAVVARITFDYNAAHPKLVFQAKRYLTDAEFEDIMAWRNNQQVVSMLSGANHTQALPAPGQVSAPVAGTPPQAVQQAPVQQPMQQPMQQPQPVNAQMPPSMQHAPVQQVVQPVPQQTPQQPGFGAPPVQQQAPQPSFGPPPVQQPTQQPPQANFGPPPVQQQAPVQQPMQVPQQAAPTQASFGPPPVQQQAQPAFGPPPVQAQAIAPPVQAPSMQQAVQSQPQVATQANPVPDSVLSAVDQMF